MGYANDYKLFLVVNGKIYKGNKPIISIMLRIKKIKEVIGTRVFTDAGDYFGEIEEANLVGNKIDGWRIKIAKSSGLAPSLGGARGLIVPHQFIKAIGEIVIVNKSVVPEKEEEEAEKKEEKVEEKKE